MKLPNPTSDVADTSLHIEGFFLCPFQYSGIAIAVVTQLLVLSKQEMAYRFFHATNFLQMTYSEKLKHPLWQKRRLEILNRDEFTCQCCGEKEVTLHVHHFIYNNKTKNPWDVDDWSLITLCEDCHWLYETNLPEVLGDILVVLQSAASNNSVDTFYRRWIIEIMVKYYPKKKYP